MQLHLSLNLSAEVILYFIYKIHLPMIYPCQLIAKSLLQHMLLITYRVSVTDFGGRICSRLTFMYLGVLYVLKFSLQQVEWVERVLHAGFSCLYVVPQCQFRHTGKCIIPTEAQITWDLHPSENWKPGIVPYTNPENTWHKYLGSWISL